MIDDRVVAQARVAVRRLSRALRDATVAVAQLEAEIELHEARQSTPAQPVEAQR